MMIDLPGSSRSHTSRLLLSAALVLVSLAAGFLIPALIAQGKWKGLLEMDQASATWVVLPVFGYRLYYSVWPFQFHMAMFAILVGGFLAAYVYYPELSPMAAAWRPSWRKGYTAAILALTCAGLAAFIVHYGNRQFGGFDCGLLIDVGWRLVQGQVPHRDFICTMPPGFYLGVKYAFELFGVRWQAVLLATAIFASATFLWIYFMLAEILQSRPLAYLGAVAIQCAGILTISYWWHNSVAMMAATVFFLACMLYLQRPQGVGPQASYVMALALLGLMKPNVAFPAAASGILCTLLGAPARARVLILTSLAVGVNLAFLAANQVNPAAMVAGYLSIASTRGFTNVGMLIMGIADAVRLVVCASVLAIPFVLWCPRFLAAARKAAAEKAGYRDLAQSLLLFSAPAVSIFAMFTNMELKDVEFPLLFCFGLILVGTGSRDDQARLARTYFCFVLALAAFDLYLGVVRYRVQLVGDFFSSEDVPLPSGVPLFGNMRASKLFHDVIEETQGIVALSPRPIFFGPRMEFAYAASRLPSPAHLPVWWHPGTSFNVDDQSDILQTWRNQCFPTLIFFKNDYTYYTPEFRMNLIKLYDRDESSARISVFRRRAGEGCPSLLLAPVKE